MLGHQVALNHSVDVEAEMEPEKDEDVCLNDICSAVVGKSV